MEYFWKPKIGENMLEQCMAGKVLRYLIELYMATSNDGKNWEVYIFNNTVCFCQRLSHFEFYGGIGIKVNSRVSWFVKIKSATLTFWIYSYELSLVSQAKVELGHLIIAYKFFSIINKWLTRRFINVYLIPLKNIYLVYIQYRLIYNKTPARR